MHIQARATPAASPPDLETFLAILSEPEPPREPINIEGVSGDDLETGGSFTFSFDHNRESHVRAWLEEKGYTVQFLEGNMGEIENPDQVVGDDTRIAVLVLPDIGPGALLRAVRRLGQANLPNRRVIRHIVVGRETQAPNRTYVQIAFLQTKG